MNRVVNYVIGLPKVGKTTYITDNLGVPRDRIYTSYSEDLKTEHDIYFESSSGVMRHIRDIELGWFGEDAHVILHLVTAPFEDILSRGFDKFKLDFRSCTFEMPKLEEGFKDIIVVYGDNEIKEFSLKDYLSRVVDNDVSNEYNYELMNHNQMAYDYISRVKGLDISPIERYETAHNIQNYVNVYEEFINFLKRSIENGENNN